MCALALSHLTAVLVFSFTTFVLACMAVDGALSGLSLFYLVFAMAQAQCAIGVFNEIFDRELDRVAKPWRTIPAGYISTSGAVLIGLAALVLALVSASRLSALSMAVLGLGAGTGVIYSPVLKRSPLSWAPYVTAYPSLPIWIWALLKRFDIGLVPIYPLAFPFALAVHLTNQLRHFDEDATMGFKGLVQHLGKSRSVRLDRRLLLICPVPLLVFGVLRQSIQSLCIVLAAAVLYWFLIVPLIPKQSRRCSADAFRTLFRRLQIAGPLILFAWLLAR